jgi:hypothetical protein
MSCVDEETLTGGGLNEVVRVGGTVRRPTGPWTPRVHELLRHLAAQGFDSAPLVHGVDERGREVLSSLPGEVGHPPLPQHLRRDNTLIAVAELVRRLHDCSVGLTHRRDGWQFEAAEPVGVIDFDVARPGRAGGTSPTRWTASSPGWRTWPG